MKCSILVLSSMIVTYDMEQLSTWNMANATFYFILTSFNLNSNVIGLCRSRIPQQLHNYPYNSSCHPKIHSQHSSQSNPPITPLVKISNDLLLDWNKIQSHYHSLSYTTGQSLHLPHLHLIPVCPRSISSHCDLWQFIKLRRSPHIRGHFFPSNIY